MSLNYVKESSLDLTEINSLRQFIDYLSETRGISVNRIAKDTHSHREYYVSSVSNPDHITMIKYTMFSDLYELHADELECLERLLDEPDV